MKNTLFGRLFGGKRVSNYTDDLPIRSLQATSMYALREMTHYASDVYENGYSSIRAIANRFMVLRPHATDANGKPLKNSPNVINCLARPNQDMSGVDFRDAMAVMTMVHDKVYILVHELKGRESVPASEGVREDRIAGFTFLENVQEEWFDGRLQYRVNVRTELGTEPRIYHPYQVIKLHDINPGNLNGGYSPSHGARRWTRIDDYIADYQSGFFENGAVPSGQFLITAPTIKEYDDIVDNLKTKHRGAGKNNNVVYTYQPIDPETGKAAQATITWVPFNVTNKDMSLKELFAQANKKIDSVYGVSAFIRAIDEAPNFATAQVIERNFVENTVRPFAIKKWGRFQHELNRITGGLGYGISFQLDTPHIAEEGKALAETDQIRVTTLTTLITAGYTLESSIDALQLPPNWKLLEKGQTVETTIDNDKPEVDEGDEAAESPKPANHHVHGEANGTNPKVFNLTEENAIYYQTRLEAPTTALMQAQVDNAIATLEPVDEDDPIDKAKAKFVDDMMGVISEILLVAGATQWEAGRMLLQEAGLIAPSEAYAITTAAEDRYRAYLKTIADSYSEDTAESIRSTLARANENSWTRTEIESALRNIMQTDAWRVTRLSVTEVNRSGAVSSIESMIKIQDESEATVEKTLQSSTGDPCPFCATFIDVWIPVGKTMVEKGATITAADGSTMVNNWDSNIGHDPHANGKCYPIYRVAS